MRATTTTHAAERSAEFNQYYTPTTTALTEIDPPVTTYFPPGETIIPGELEQLLLPLSPPILPVDFASDIIFLIIPDEEPSAPASLLTVSVKITVRSPILLCSPGSPDLPYLHVGPESVGPESPSRSYHAEIPSIVQALGRFPDVLQIYCGIHVISPDPDPDPVYICLTTDHHADTVTEVTFDIDSIGVRWNPTQIAVSDLQSSLYLDPLLILHYTFGWFIGFENISLYILFPQLYREKQIMILAGRSSNTAAASVLFSPA
ncbi:hypothetical protein BDV23DRAFT_177253 [Aspergillus alliaceus]|uniref:Uncharacterized protein n=1 Tax=Petromyces alliaceus TaxID=209559 RepID=A0A5N7BQS4_PETAA|nr:hypothetical protein BDV23DRAFT_177253 [Aspergillus alliaceus]